MKKIIQRISTLTAMLVIGFTLFSGMAFASADPPATTVVKLSAAEQACKGAGGTYSAGSAAKGTAGTKEYVAAVPAGCSNGGTELFKTDGTGILDLIINVLSFVVGAAAVIMLIVGGVRYVVSNGDQNAVTGAKNTILYAIVGLVIVFLARAAVFFIIGSFV